MPAVILVAARDFALRVGRLGGHIVEAGRWNCVSMGVTSRLKSRLRLRFIQENERNKRYRKYDLDNVFVAYGFCKGYDAQTRDSTCKFRSVTIKTPASAEGCSTGADGTCRLTSAKMWG